jgi:hypothetical protein
MTDPAVMRCWQCGVEPDEVLEVTRMGDAEPSFLPGRWPPGDHPHAERPPTPAELSAAGDAVMARMLEVFAS